VPLEEPSWWYGPADAWPARALAPAAALWGRLAARRLVRGRLFRSRLPVICVGNFTAGGTGKTPLAIRIGRELQALGRRPAFLTRGYGGITAGPLCIDPEGDAAARVGDEPLLLARVAPTIVARDRAAGAAAIERLDGGQGADTIVMDDGLQNPRLAKDLVVAVVDGRRGLGNGRVMPAGPLRAPLALQLDLVDAIVVNRVGGGDAVAQPVEDWLRGRFTGPVMVATTRPLGSLDWLREAKVVAYCGIGAPRRFFDLLAAQGARVAAEAVFADHHAFTEREAEHLLALAARHGARLVSTEKDLARLSGLGGVRRALAAASSPLVIETHLEPRDAERLRALLESAVVETR
jgi:tetraacyldisaccharide 4'-kinase